MTKTVPGSGPSSVGPGDDRRQDIADRAAQHHVGHLVERRRLAVHDHDAGPVGERDGDGLVDREHREGCPDGQEQIFLFQDVQGATPPSTPPDTAHADWLTQQNDSLLIIISTLVGNDEASVNNYLANENAGSSPYQQMDRHIDTINLLVSP